MTHLGGSYSDHLGWSVAVMVGEPTLIVAAAQELTVSGHKAAGGLVVWPVDAAGVGQAHHDHGEQQRNAEAVASAWCGPRPLTTTTCSR